MGPLDEGNKAQTLVGDSPRHRGLQWRLGYGNHGGSSSGYSGGLSRYVHVPGLALLVLATGCGGQLDEHIEAS